jgi:hypothetical protein
MSTIYGADVYLVRALEKVELAIRQTMSDQYVNVHDSSYVLGSLADNLRKIIKDTYDGRSTD